MPSDDAKAEKSFGDLPEQIAEILKWELQQTVFSKLGDQVVKWLDRAGVSIRSVNPSTFAERVRAHLEARDVETVTNELQIADRIIREWRIWRSSIRAPRLHLEIASMLDWERKQKEQSPFCSRLIDWFRRGGVQGDIFPRSADYHAFVDDVREHLVCRGDDEVNAAQLIVRDFWQWRLDVQDKRRGMPAKFSKRRHPGKLEGGDPTAFVERDGFSILVAVPRKGFIRINLRKLVAQALEAGFFAKDNPVQRLLWSNTFRALTKTVDPESYFADLDDLAKRIRAKQPEADTPLVMTRSIPGGRLILELNEPIEGGAFDRWRDEAKAKRKLKRKTVEDRS